MKPSLIFACLAALFPLAAWAQEAEPPTSIEQETHLVSVTWSPVHLIVGVVELTGEVQVAPRIAAALIAGYGSQTQQTVSLAGTTNYDVSLFEIGAQAAYYLVGDFDTGLKVGAEGGYLGASTSASGVEATGSGVWYGAFLGGKKTFDIGATLGLDLGVQQAQVSARASGGGSTATAKNSDTGVLLNLQAGWSF